MKQKTIKFTVENISVIPTATELGIFRGKECVLTLPIKEGKALLGAVMDFVNYSLVEARTQSIMRGKRLPKKKK